MSVIPHRSNFVCRILFAPLLLAFSSTATADERTSKLPTEESLKLSSELRGRCLKILRTAVRSPEFWPSIHAAEALSLAGRGAEVRRLLEPKLKIETDDQKRCGLSRELMRAGDVGRAEVMLTILRGKNTFGHTHAAESLFKLGHIGDGKWMRKRFAESKDLRFRLMAAAALGKSGDKKAMVFIREMLGHRDMELARVSVWILARIGQKADIPAIRKNRTRAKDDLTRAYFDHALAMHGDPAGRHALLKNLSHMDPAVRTYAAVFASEARMSVAAEPLEELLDDANIDVRVRAAQSLLVLSKPRPKK